MLHVTCSVSIMPPEGATAASRHNNATAAHQLLLLFEKGKREEGGRPPTLDLMYGLFRQSRCGSGGLRVHGSQNCPFAVTAFPNAPLIIGCHLR